MAPNILEQALLDQKDTTPFYESYRAFKHTFATQVLPEVTQAAVATDSVFLTDHGPDHIARVIQQACNLVRQSREKPSVYEAFLLLIAIHIHDIGNATGRIEHEQKALDIWEKVYGPLGFDELDKFLASQIARVHGGTIARDMDTIRSLEADTIWRNERVRPRYLASVLRLADEMAEDRHRASKLLLALDSLKKESEVYHVYAAGLHSFEADAETCTLLVKFAFAKKWFEKKLGKGDKEIDLLYEIYGRTLKTFTEAIYCSKYTRNAFNFDRVRVTIDIMDDTFRSRIQQIGYTIHDDGYPSVRGRDIFAIVPELANYRGNGPLTPETLGAMLAQSNQDSNDAQADAH